MDFILKVQKIKEPNTGNWSTTLSGGYENITGKVYDIKQYREGDVVVDDKGNPILGQDGKPTRMNNGYYSAKGEITNLINPFTNQTSNSQVTLSKIEDSFEDSYGWDFQQTSKIYFSYIAASVADSISKKYKKEYGVDIKFRVTEAPEEKKPDPAPTEKKEIPTSGTASGATASGATASAGATASGPQLYGEFIFDVTKENSFSNPQFGGLTIVTKGIQKDEVVEVPYEEALEMMQEEEELDEYSESEFKVTEDQLFVVSTSNEVIVNTELLNKIKGNDPENPDPKLSTDTTSKYKASKDKDANIKAIIKAAKERGIKNKYAIAAILAIVSKESAFVPTSEASYANTAAKQIKKIFLAARSKTDAEIDTIKKDPVQFFNLVYGGDKEKGTLKYGNAWNEGYKYRGRGFNQITFKSLYEDYGKRIGKDLLGDPDLLNTVDVAAAALSEYFKKAINGAPKVMKSHYNFTDINTFSNLDDAVGAIYHANAGFGNSFETIAADSTGGRKKAFKNAGPLYNTYESSIS